MDIQNVQYDARGLYICEAFNDIGYDRRDITLSIQRKLFTLKFYFTKLKTE